jgi:GTP cyclohydrolase I
LDKVEYSPERKIAEAIGEMLRHIAGDNYINDQHLKDTPERVARAYVREMFRGYYTSEPRLTMFNVDESRDQMVTVAGIQFYSTCAHHMLPFQGKAHIGYIPDEQMMGYCELYRRKVRAVGSRSTATSESCLYGL